jgi:hypothetical protein
MCRMTYAFSLSRNRPIWTVWRLVVTVNQINIDILNLTHYIKVCHYFYNKVKLIKINVKRIVLNVK